MFKRKNRQETSEQLHQDTPENEIKALKYPQPKILLIDMPSHAEVMLREAGYNVSVGSFGTPYKVPKTDKLLPVINHSALPINFTEQDIVVVDLALPKAVDELPGEKHTSDGQNDWWASCKWGIIDPRPRLMVQAQEDFDRILTHGGVFIIFAEQRISQKLAFGHIKYQAFVKESDISYDNWSFLSILDCMNVKSYQGQEIVPVTVDHPLIQLLSQHVNDAQIDCTVEPSGQWLREDWLPLAKNRYEATVAGTLLPNEGRKGRVFIFPQLRDKTEFIANFISQVLPDLEPQLFPYAEDVQWMQQPEYELPKIVDFRAKIKELQEQVQKQVAELEKAIEAERIEHGYLHSLLSDTGAPLVASVRKILEVLGFRHVLDADEEMLKTGKSGPKREDLQIHDTSPLLLVEVKGISNLPKEASALQVWKYVAPRMRDLNRTDIRGLSIINHQRHIPPLERENKMPFSQDILINAEDQQFGLLTTWDLFRLTRNYLRHNWKHDDVKDLFYQNGRIEPVPRHYQYIGVVEEFWEKVGAVGVRIEVEELRQGDRIAFELPVDFEEQDVQSLQVNKMQVDVAGEGMLVGILTQFSKAQLKKGLRVFKLLRKYSSATE
jgi:hypothetical protein